jgi:plastocyanin
VKLGEEATWTSREDNSHSVDHAHGKLNSAALHTYQNFRLRFTEPGESYHYRVHPKMSETIVVRLW